MMPGVVACGSRLNAYDKFQTALTVSGAGGQHHPLLLVDSEGPVSVTDPWDHLAQRAGDEWERPAGAREEDAHLMVQQMESWFLADREVLAKYFGHGFAKQRLPGKPEDVESVPRERTMAGLESASRPSEKGKYSKARDSFEILSKIDPSKVQKGSRWARRLIEHLQGQQP